MGGERKLYTLNGVYAGCKVSMVSVSATLTAGKLNWSSWLDWECSQQLVRLNIQQFCYHGKCLRQAIAGVDNNR